MNKLQSARQAAGMTQQQLAEKSGVSLSSIQKYERDAKDINRAGMNAVLALCNALDCKVEDLQDGWITVEQDPEDKILAMFEDLSPECQRETLKTIAENIGMIVFDPKEKMHDLELVEGDFLEGETVTVKVDGKTVKRKVRYDLAEDDMCILCDGRKYFYSEF